MREESDSTPIVAQGNFGYIPPWGFSCVGKATVKKDALIPIESRAIYGAILQGILTLATAYSLVNPPNSAANKYLSDISNSLMQINQTLQGIQRQLDTILYEVRRLEKVLLAGIEAQSMKELIGKSSYCASTLSSLSSEDKILSNLPRFTSLIDDLGQNLSAIVALRGVDAALVVAPLFSTWLSSSLAYEKGLKMQKPDYSMASPWANPFTQEIQRLYAEMFALFERLDRTYPSDARRLVKGQYAVEPSAGRFLYVRSRFLGGPEYLSEDPPSGFGETILEKVGRLRVSCVTVDDNNEIVELGKLQVTVFDGRRFYWKDVEAGSDAREDEALRLLKVNNERLAAIGSFYQIAPTAYEKRDEVMKCFDPPNGW